MTIRKARTAKPRTKYATPIALERLNAMIEALQKDELDEAMRKEIVDALDCFFITLLIERDSHTPGRRKASMTWSIADLVRCLVDEHDVTLKAAIIAALPGADDRLKNRVARAYQKIRNGKYPQGKINHESAWYAQAVSRLKAQSRNK